MRRFLIIWLGQFVSVAGSGLTGFALGVWLLQRTGSVTQFTMVAFFAVLPGTLLSPLAGAYVSVCGPQFETPAEVAWLAGYGDVVGMSAAPEARAACTRRRPSSARRS